MANVDRAVTPLQLPPGLDPALWFTRLDDATDPNQDIRAALAARQLGNDDAHDRLLVFRTVTGLMKDVVGPHEDDESWRVTFQAIDVERPVRPLFREYV